MSVALAFWDVVPAIYYVENDKVYDYSYQIWNGSGATLSKKIISSVFRGTAHNGTAPYSYLWQAVSNPSSIAITDPVGFYATFSKTLIAGAARVVGTFRLRVTDATAAVAYSSIITVELEYVDNIS